MLTPYMSNPIYAWTNQNGFTATLMAWVVNKPATSLKRQIGFGDQWTPPQLTDADPKLGFKRLKTFAGCSPKQQSQITDAYIEALTLVINTADASFDAEKNYHYSLYFGEYNEWNNAISMDADHPDFLNSCVLFSPPTSSALADFVFRVLQHYRPRPLCSRNRE